MPREIEVINNDSVVFHKSFWRPEQLELALSVGFLFSADNNTVTAVIAKTIRKALFEFIKYCFPSILSHDSYSAFRDYVFGQIGAIYQEQYKRFQLQQLPKLGYQDKLYSHQKESLFIGMGNDIVFLALSQGLGKTIISASRSKIIGIKTTIIVCPSIVKWNWYRELTALPWGFNPLYFTILDASKSRTVYAFQERFVIVNYEMVNKNMQYLQDLDCGHIILDEAQYIKSSSSDRYKATSKLRSHHPNALLTFLSGTPIKNRPNDLFAYLKLANHPLGKNHSAFLKEYTHTQSGRGGDHVIGGRNREKLHMMLSNFMFRKTKEECLDLPEKVITKYFFKLDDYRQEYDKIIEEMANNEEGKGLNGSLHSLNILVTKSKIPGIIELIDNLIEQERKVVVFTSYREPINTLEEYYKDRCVKIDGTVSAFDRDGRIQKFKNDENCMVFLGNIQAAGVGITLTNSCDVIFMNFPFTPSELAQATDRCVLAGQKVITENGFKNIEDVVIGDIVYTHLGNYKKVLNTSSKLEKKKCFVDIKYKGYDKPLSVTEDHLIYVWNKITNEFKWIAAGLLDINIHFMVFPGLNLIPTFPKKVKTVRIAKRIFENNWGRMQKGRCVIIPDKIELTKYFLRALGWYLAEGWATINEGKSYTVNICGNFKTEKHKIESFADILSKSFDVNKFSTYTSKNNCHTATIRSKDMAHTFIEWFGKNVHSKKIPYFIFQLTAAQQRYFLDGFYEGDGYKRKNTQQASIKNSGLAIQICQLETILGNTPSIRTATKGGYSLEYSLNDKIKRAKLSKNVDGISISPISEIRKYKPKRNADRVYDLTIENDHSFVVGMASVHNCHRIGQKSSVNVYYTICEQTIDEHLFNLVADKAKDINEIIDNGKAGVVEYDNIPEALFKQLLGKNDFKISII